MTGLQGLVYAVALAAFRAWFDILDARRLAEREVVTDADRARAARFRDAVRLLLERKGDPGRDDPAPAGR